MLGHLSNLFAHPLLRLFVSLSRDFTPNSFHLAVPVFDHIFGVHFFSLFFMGAFLLKITPISSHFHCRQHQISRQPRCQHLAYKLSRLHTPALLLKYRNRTSEQHRQSSLCVLCFSPLWSPCSCVPPQARICYRRSRCFPSNTRLCRTTLSARHHRLAATTRCRILADLLPFEQCRIFCLFACFDRH